MKKSVYIIISILLLVIIVIGFIIKNKSPQPGIQNIDFIYMGLFEKSVIEDDHYIFTNYKDYYSIFKSNELNENDFENNNYILVPIDYDSCSESDVTPTNYEINKEHVDIIVEYKASCGVCGLQYLYYLLKVDKTISNAELNIEYKAINDPKCDPDISYKPLIYLYPEKDSKVIVKLGYPELLTTTYPKYEDEWNIIAKPNGEIIDKNGRTYYGLYWEGFNYFQSNYKDGYVVSREDSASFLEEKLEILGLNEREANEFIIYWLPKLEENEYNLIRFATIDNIDKQMPLYIMPTPDTIIRVFMTYKPIANKIEIKPQLLTTPKRRGFTVVEWGGSLIK